MDDREFEAADLSLRSPGAAEEWRVAHVAFGPWKLRTAP